MATGFSGYSYITAHNLYYVNSEPDKTCAVSEAAESQGHHPGPDKSAEHNKLFHVHPSYEKHREAIDLIRWVLSVAGIPADSPRFAYYVSRWLVPDKIDRAKSAGTFEDAVSRCPPIDPAWVWFVPKALAEFEQFKRGMFPSKNAESKQNEVPTLMQKFQTA